MESVLTPTSPALLRDILTSKSVTTATGHTLPLQSHIRKREGLFIQRIIRDIKPRRTLEVGMAYGISSLYICEALREVDGMQHTAIDPLQFCMPEADTVSFADHRGWDGIGALNVQRAGYGNLLDVVPESSEVALPRLIAEGRRYEFALIDGWHTFDATLVDFCLIDRLLPVGGVVVFDDTDYDSVNAAVRYVVKNRAYTFYPESWLGRPTRGHVWQRRIRRALRQRKSPNFVALIKQRDELRGDGTNGSRRWDEHVAF